jgi:hypothetical protein
VQSTRRKVLKAGLGAGALFLPLPYAWVWAQSSEGAAKLAQAPKLALVLGNSKYKDAPLKNPANDARAIGEALKAAGFEVTARLDAGKADMAAAVQAYVKALAARKAVGVFYYAGHGIQLAWKNYMLPVDAEVDTIADVQKQAVEVHALMEGLTRAGNPMNVVILDACRDNPFGNLKGVDHKGLSQMDAPNLTLLAYATSPGNVASDGDGVNGLYTENLLREMKVPEAKIEDVFKRVRLGVRRKSNGAQVPWESTSLEDDFWFIPPKTLKAASDDEKDKLFEDELAQWEKIKESADPAPLEAYLRRYPSGPFSELAQLQLDRALAKQGEKKVQIAPAEGNPYTQGFVPADTNFKVGDTYEYAVLDPETRVERRRISAPVTRVSDTEVVFGNDTLVLDRLGNTVKLPDGRRFTPRQDQPTEYAIGKKWTTRFGVIVPNGRSFDSEFEFRIARREKITVPAGTFDCYVIEGEGYATTPFGRTELRLTRWMAPDKVRRPIVTEQYRKVARKPAAQEGGFGKGFGKKGGGFGKGPGGGGAQDINERLELVSYKQS